MSHLLSLWDNIILKSPRATLFGIFLITAFFSLFVGQFRLDASSESLVLENDPALKYYQSIAEDYGSDDFLVVTYSPREKLFTRQSLNIVAQLQDDLSALPGVKSVTSIMNVPLVNTNNVTLEQLQNNVLTLADQSVEPLEAQQEFITSPLYKNLLVSPDGNTTALQVNLLPANNEIDKSALMAQQAQLIKSVRSVMANYRDQAELFLGGLPMITADSIQFISHDLSVFGTGIFILLVVILVLAFKKPRWVLLPLVTCIVAALILTGLLGLLDWPVTVVSANFISLMLIMTLSFSIHLIVRFQELHAEHPEKSQHWLVLQTLRKKYLPCLYTALTTMVAFGSLLFSFIRPVIDFGWMMTMGIAIAFILSFTLFPAMLMLFKKDTPLSRNNISGDVTAKVAKMIKAAPRAVIFIFVGLFLVSVFGITKLTVENRFIDYFKESTEIYQGMSLIDEKLGGTTPLDVIINAPQSYYDHKATTFEPDPAMLEEFGMTAQEFIATQTNNGGITATSYWFNVERLKQVDAIHNYLEQLPDSGKVLSVASTIAMIKPLDEDIVNDNFYLSILYKKLPAEIKSIVLNPYMSDDGNQLRFSIRIYESDKNLKRNALLTNIKKDLQEKFNIAPEQIRLTGMAVMYNNMLQSLFKSQILTIGVVFIAILLMFIVLFKNLRLSIIALIPNVIAASMVLGIMGLFAIPLDLMTITIAAISVGIAVDNSIHYIHRFRNEYERTQDYWLAVQNSHGSIGRALYYTSVTITLGFSILIMSNFTPTMYFGLLTGFAMLMALVANLTLLPLLLVTFKPLLNK